MTSFTWNKLIKQIRDFQDRRVDGMRSDCKWVQDLLGVGGGGDDDILELETGDGCTAL